MVWCYEYEKNEFNDCPSYLSYVSFFLHQTHTQPIVKIYVVHI